MPLLTVVLAGDADEAARLQGPELADLEVLTRGGDAFGEARGDYVWFLEHGARLAPGALAGVAEALRAAQPDLLLVDGGAHRRLLGRVARDGVTTLDRRPGLADVAPGLGDKVLRRDFIRGLGVAIGDGPGGELALTWPALLAADRIAATPAARYEQHGGGSRPRPDGLAHYEPVFAFLDAHPELPAERRRLVAPAMLRHELAALDRLGGAERRAHFDALSEAWRRHRPGDEPLRGGRAVTLEARLVERSDRRAFALVHTALRGRRALARRRARVLRRSRRARRKLHAIGLDRYYRARRRQPIDPQLAVFAAYWYRGYACNPRAIYEKARELVPGMRGVWIVNPKGAAQMPDGVEYVVAGTREYYDVLARARILVNNVNFPDHYVKREGTLHVQTHHGTPVKYMGIDLKTSAVAGQRMDFEALLRRCARWDFSVTSNHFSTEIWERAYPTRYESLEVGYPRNDALARPDAETARRVREALGVGPDQVAVLYAPTHREYWPSYVPVLDVGALAEAIGPNYVLLVRAHYFYDADPQLAELHRQGRVRDVAAYASVEELCLAADVLMTDYSSIMFDYAVLDRPIVIHAPDWDTYRSLRGTYFDLMAEPPGIVTTTAAEVVEAFESGAVWGDAAARSRAEFRARFCTLDDGRAAERVVRRVWLGEREPARQDPAAFTR